MLLLFDGLEDLSEGDRDALTGTQNRWMKAMEEYRDQVVSLQSEFLSDLAKRLNDTEDYLAFYINLTAYNEHINSRESTKHTCEPVNTSVFCFNSRDSFEQ